MLVCLFVCVCVFNRHITGSLDLEELRGWAASQFLTYICEHAVKTLNSSYPADRGVKLHSGPFKQKSRLIQQGALIIHTVSRLQTFAECVCVLLSFCGLFSISVVCVWVCRHQTNDRCQTRQHAVFLLLCTY